MSFVERSIVLCPYLGESTIRGSTLHVQCDKHPYNVILLYNYCATLSYSPSPDRVY